MFALAAITACLLAGSILYCVLVLVAARDYLSQAPGTSGTPTPIRVLKPLSGVDEGLETNLRSFFQQDHPEFELLFAVREANDPAIQVVERLRLEFPARAVRMIITGEPPYPNAKVFSLDHMQSEARHDLLVMSDSDIRVAPGFLRAIAADFSDQRVALATCPYRATAGPSVWSNLEAEGMNTEFLAGLLVARLVEGVKFAVGPTIAARKSALRATRRLCRPERLPGGGFRHGQIRRRSGFRRNPIAQYCPAPYRKREPGRECIAPVALGKKHPAVAPGGLPRPSVRSYSAAGPAGLRVPALLVADAGVGGGSASRGGLGHLPLDSGDSATLDAIGDRRRPAFLLLAGGVRGEHDSLAGTPLLSVSRRPV